MSITWDTTKDGINASGVAFVDFLGLHIKPVFTYIKRYQRWSSKMTKDKMYFSLTTTAGFTGTI